MKKNKKKCLNCGKSFKCPPSSKTVTCSKECSSRHRSRMHLGISNTWSEESRSQLSEKGQTDNLKAGTEAALKSPKSGPFETNVHAKNWTIESPDGDVFEVRNLSLWCRENAHLFDRPAKNAMAGIRQMHASMRGKTKRPVSQWRGWKLLDVKSSTG